MKTSNSITLLIIFLITSISFGQNSIKETETTVILNGVEFSKDAQGFSNLFEIKDTTIKVDVNLAHYSHAFKVVNIYRNITIIKVNGMYSGATKTKQYIKELNKTHNIKFIR